jgi:hypothetical protein
MIRRRRRTREIPFSLDSFLDVVANVVGIIIRLILVAWVGARTYTSLVPPAPAAAPAAGPSLALPRDPLEDELARRRRELEKSQERLLQQLRQLPHFHAEQEMAGQELASLTARRQDLAKERASLGEAQAKQNEAARDLVPSLAELRERGKHLQEEITNLEKLPPVKKVLRYRAPVSRVIVQEEETHFECRGGRVTYIDFPGFQAEADADREARTDHIRSQGAIDGVTQPSGAFRLRYKWELNKLTNSGRLEFDGYVEPVAALRGETVQQALAAGSDFHHIVDGIDPSQTVVTFWVYPDSFALFRQLRDYLYGRNVEVAARLLAAGDTIGRSSRYGSKSRGQ